MVRLHVIKQAETALRIIVPEGNIDQLPVGDCTIAVKDWVVGKSIGSRLLLKEIDYTAHRFNLDDLLM